MQVNSINNNKAKKQSFGMALQNPDLARMISTEIRGITEATPSLAAKAKKFDIKVKKGYSFYSNAVSKRIEESARGMIFPSICDKTHYTVTASKANKSLFEKVLHFFNLGPKATVFSDESIMDITDEKQLAAILEKTADSAIEDYLKLPKVIKAKEKRVKHYQERKEFVNKIQAEEGLLEAMNKAQGKVKNNLDISTNNYVNTVSPNPIFWWWININI